MPASGSAPLIECSAIPSPESASPISCALRPDRGADGRDRRRAAARDPVHRPVPVGPVADRCGQAPGPHASHPAAGLRSHAVVGAGNTGHGGAGERPSSRRPPDRVNMQLGFGHQCYGISACPCKGRFFSYEVVPWDRSSPSGASEMFPASAGMLPENGCCPRSSRSAPCARGDVPFIGAHHAYPPFCSLRMQGWSRPADQVRRGRRVVPTHLYLLHPRPQTPPHPP